jgi:hypothetical protein
MHLARYLVFGNNWLIQTGPCGNIYSTHSETCKFLLCCSVWQCVAVCCSVLQCVLQCVYHLNARNRHRVTYALNQPSNGSVMLHVAVFCSVLQCVAACCSVLQCVAECRSVLRCVVVCCSVCCSLCITLMRGIGIESHIPWVRVVLSCSVLQCVAVCRSVLQCVTLCHIVLQCVAVCASPWCEE